MLLMEVHLDSLRALIVKSAVYNKVTIISHTTLRLLCTITN